MSYFNGAILRRMRETRRLTMATVASLTGVSIPTISRIENGQIDPRMSTVTRLLSCYGGSLADLEASAPETVSLSELKEQGRRNAEHLSRAGFVPSDPMARLERKQAVGVDTTAESEILAVRT